MKGRKDEVIQATQTYLQMFSPYDLIPDVIPDGRHLLIEKITDCSKSFFRYLNRKVGKSFHWIDRLDWTDEKIG
jgi:hypothetical protein